MKIKRSIFAFLLLFFSFFVFVDEINAAVKVRGYYPLTQTSSYIGNETYSRGGNTRYVYDTGIFLIGGTHAYCIEPSAPLSGSGYQNNDKKEEFTYEDYKNLTSTQITNILYILNYAYKDAAPTTFNINKYVKISAAQGLIWEVALGERTGFSSNKPNSSPAKKSFYTVIHNSKNSYVKSIATEYDRIVTSIRNSFLTSPGPKGKTFELQGNAKTLPMAWNAKTKKYELKLSDTKFSYWTAKNQNGLSVSMNANSISISSTQPIDKNSPKLVAISIKNQNGVEAFVYTDSKYQDVVTIGGTSMTKYIKVYTPEYQLKVIKKSALNGKALSGVKFNVCTSSSCTKASQIANITTGSNGEAVYKNLPSPGTYYVKEVSAPTGYELDSKSYAVNVTTSHVSDSSSYGTITIENQAKQFNLTKTTIDENGKVVVLNDGCGTGNYTGPEFEIRENGNPLYFKESGLGAYVLANKDDEGATTKLKTCKGKFAVYSLPNCNYTISEVKAPEGLTLPNEPTKAVNICGSSKNVSFTNGFTGLEFQKKDENGNFLAGGKFTLQVMTNNIYRDVLLKKKAQGYYEYSAELTEKDNDVTYIFETIDNEEEKGKAFIKNLPPGEYRIVEKEAPSGYNLIEDKDSTAIVKIKDTSHNDYYLTELINKKTSIKGSNSSAELIVTITTGRKVPNYIFIIGGLSVLLVITIILRKKVRK